MDAGSVRDTTGSISAIEAIGHDYRRTGLAEANAEQALGGVG